MSLSTLEASLIYSAKNGHQWAANGILFIQKKMKSCKSAPSIHKQQGPLAALATPTKVQSSFQSIIIESESETNVSLHKNTTVKIAICTSAVTLL